MRERAENIDMRHVHTGAHLAAEQQDSRSPVRKASVRKRLFKASLWENICIPRVGGHLQEPPVNENICEGTLSKRLICLGRTYFSAPAWAEAEWGPSVPSGLYLWLNDDGKKTTPPLLGTLG